MIVYRENWNGRITVTLFSYFTISELIHLSGVCRMFNEITGSRGLLMLYNGHRSQMHTIDRILPNTTNESFSRSQSDQSGHLGNNVTLLSEDNDYFPYKYEVIDRQGRFKSVNKRKRKSVADNFPRINVTKVPRMSQISPISINSSNADPDYDIIRDEVGYTKLVGPMFYQSICSNSSKYVTETAKFHYESEFNSSKGARSLNEDLFASGKFLGIRIKRGQIKTNFDERKPSNTHTQGFFKHTNFLPSPNNKLLDSVRSTNRATDHPIHENNTISKLDNGMYKKSKVNFNSQITF